MKITSRDNQKLKYARKTRDGKFDDLIFIEGLRLAEECLRSNLAIKEVFHTPAFVQNERSNDLINGLSEMDSEVFEVSDQLLATVSDTKNSQGIILIATKPERGKDLLEAQLNRRVGQFPLFVLLHEINNPSNLGAILRTSEAAGVAGIILSKHSTDGFSPQALRASMGASFRIPIWDNADFSEVLNWAKENDLASICANAKAKKSYVEVDWKKPRLLVFGSEAHGLSSFEIDQIEEDVSIPMDNDVESLNLAVSSGIILFEAKRRKEL